MEFKINRKVVVLRSVPLVVQKAMEYCDKMQDGDLLTGNALAMNLGYTSNSTISKNYCHPALAKYKAYRGGINYWGNPKTIKEFKKELEKTKI